MTFDDKILRAKTRRHFFKDAGVGIGRVALASMMADGALSAKDIPPSPMAAKEPHFTPQVKNVIYLFMAGGPSQLEMFDYKPVLQKHDGEVAPDSILDGKRFAFMGTFAENKPRLLATKREFKQYGQSGMWASDLVPEIGSVGDDVAMIRGIQTDNFNHAPAKCFMNTGSIRFGRPSMGSWATYGIGSESADLPGFVVLQSGGRGPRGGAGLWSSGFLPTAYQGVPFRSGGDPILNLSTAPGVTKASQAETLDAIREMNLLQYENDGDPEIMTRVAAYEMAYRMQTSGPDLIDFGQETQETLDMYGAKPGEASYANNCLLARRMIERGVRFVQLYHADWDHHADIGGPLEKVTREIDRPTAALIKDLKQRGLLDDTLVIWGGEFGRTPMAEVREQEAPGKQGRNHHIDAFPMLMTGGKIRRGHQIGGTDDLGFNSVGEKIHVHDIQATILHMLGLDHTKLTYTFQGRPFRLTDVGGRVLHDLFA
ncbi:MAG: DUF1501 domain-containing protein [Acidobacteria bacterium]|nr:DUF1501 domain-containing protein [Acidobacteriota bacterium]MDA1236569.1 DUF1501 domain-containing protein [Acidobacteriota bacterium]